MGSQFDASSREKHEREQEQRREDAVSRVGPSRRSRTRGQRSTHTRTHAYIAEKNGEVLLSRERYPLSPGSRIMREWECSCTVTLSELSSLRQSSRRRALSSSSFSPLSGSRLALHAVFARYEEKRFSSTILALLDSSRDVYCNCSIVSSVKH